MGKKKSTTLDEIALTWELHFEHLKFLEHVDTDMPSFHLIKPYGVRGPFTEEWFNNLDNMKVSMTEYVKMVADPQFIEIGRIPFKVCDKYCGVYRNYKLILE